MEDSDQTHVSGKNPREQYLALFGSDTSVASPRKDYRKEWGYAIDRVKEVMGIFDPKSMRGIRAGIRRLAHELTGEIMPMDDEGSYDPIKGLVNRLGSAAEKAKEVYDAALSDQNYHDAHALEGMRDFCGFVDDMIGYLKSMQEGKNPGSDTVSMINRMNAYNSEYCMNGVPDREAFSGMILSCNQMMKRLWEDRTNNRS